MNKLIKVFSNRLIILISFIFLILLSLSSLLFVSLNNVAMSFYILMIIISLSVIAKRYFSDKNIFKEIDFLSKNIDDFNKITFFKNDFDELRDRLYGKLGSMDELWNSFINSFHKTDDKLTQTVDAEYFFNTDTLLKDRMNYKLLNYIPQALVGLGLLGTFLGLTIGLSEMDLGNKENIKTSIETLISGTKTSFSTSLFGMYFSIVFSFFINFYIGFYENKIVKLKNKLNMIFPKSNEDEKFNILQKGIKEIVTSNKEMAESIANQIESSMLEINKGISNSFSSGFQESIGESLDKIFTTDFVEKFENIKNELIEVSKQNNKFINHYAEKINEINIYSENIKNDYKKLSSEVSEKFNELMNKIFNIYSQMNNNYSDFMELTKEINNIQKENREYLGEFEHFSEKSFKITNSLDNFIKTESNIINIWKQYENSFSDLGEKLENNLNNYNKILDRTSQEYTEIIRDGVDEYTDKLKKGVFALFKDYDSNLTKVVEEFNTIIKHLSEKLSDSNNVLSKHREILNKNEKQIGRLNILLNKKDLNS